MKLGYEAGAKATSSAAGGGRSSLMAAGWVFVPALGSALAHAPVLTDEPGSRIDRMRQAALESVGALRAG
jgi:hypothetical protein